MQTSLSARIMQLVRYPLKGFTGEALNDVELTDNAVFPYDRAFAIENGPSGFNPQAPKHFPKARFLMRMRNESVARLTTRFNAETRTLTFLEAGVQLIHANVDEAAGRDKIETFINERFKDELRGSAHFLSAPDHSFSDVPDKAVHLVNLATLREIETLSGARLDPLRFRANIYIDGAPAWSEFDWIEQKISCGDVQMQAYKKTRRCAAIDVDPTSALRNTRLAPLLMQTYGHCDVGIYLTVKKGGRLRLNDTLNIVE